MAQLEFDWSTLDDIDRARERFQAFHLANTNVMLELVGMARRLKDCGVRQYGIAALWEVLRYNHAVKTDDPTSQLKLNNDYRAFYAREIMRRHPDLDGFFTTRRSQADGQ